MTRATIYLLALLLVRAERVHVGPEEVHPDSESYAYIKAARAKLEAGGEDDLALFADRPAPEVRAVDDPAIVEAANWAVNKLRGMSDSGIFKTLSLRRILSALTQPGVFHDNTILNLTLASPALLDGDETSNHTVVVMVDIEDGVRSFAIDEFPLMDPDAVEAAWRQKVEASVLARDVEFRKLDWEARAWNARRASRGVKEGVAECLDLCDERQAAINDFDFEPDAELEQILIEEAAAEAVAALPPDLTAFLAEAPLRAAERAAPVGYGRWDYPETEAATVGADGGV